MKRFAFLFIVLCALIGSVVMFAQPETPEPVPPSNWYASVTGIIAFTIAITSGIKRVLANVKALNAVPTWVYVIVISEVLTFTCVQFFHTMPGPVVQALYQALILAASASGAYEWFFNGNVTKPLAATALSAGVKVPMKNKPDSIK
jgi:uncharacterized membrane protein YfcA